MSPKIVLIIDKDIIRSQLNEFETIIEQTRNYDESLANNFQVTYNLLEILIENDDNNFIIETAETRQLLGQIRNIIDEYNLREYNSPPTTTNNTEETTINNIKSPEETNQVIKFFTTIACCINALFLNIHPIVCLEGLDNPNITGDMTPVSNSLSFRPFNHDFIGKEGI
jgi:hypothetical protein